MEQPEWTMFMSTVDALATKYTPSIHFELAYVLVDYGDSIDIVTLYNKESVVRFRTTVTF